MSINGDGSRDREHSIIKPPDTFRIAVLGDSFAEAFQVDREKAFWAVMERKLESCASFGGRKVEVINFGQSGMGTAMELLALRHRAWKYSPDLIVLALFIGNDISDNSRVLKKSDRHPYFVYEGDRLVVDDAHVKAAYHKYGGWWNDARASVYNSLRVLQVVDRAVVMLEEWRARGNHREGDSPRSGSEWGLDPAIYREPSDEIWEDAWRVTEGLLMMMRDEVRAGNARFRVVILGGPVEAHPHSRVRRDYEKRIGVQDLCYPMQRLESFCASEEILALALTPHFQAYAAVSGVFLHGFGSFPGTGHWNEAGHHLAGEIIAQWLCGRLE